MSSAFSVVRILKGLIVTTFNKSRRFAWNAKSMYQIRTEHQIGRCVYNFRCKKMYIIERTN